MAYGGFRYTESTRKYTEQVTGGVYRVTCFRIPNPDVSPHVRTKEWVKEVWVPKMEAADFYDKYHLKRDGDLFHMVSSVRVASEKPEDVPLWNV